MSTARLLGQLLVFLLALAACAAMWRDPMSPLGASLWCALLVVLPLPWLSWPLAVDRKDLALAGVWFIAALVPRLYDINSLPLGLHGDEAKHALVVKDIQQLGLADFFGDRAWGVPTLGFGWEVALVSLLGPSIAAVRTASALVGALTVAVVYLWGREIGGRWLGLFAAALMLTAHTHLLLSHLGTVNAQAPFLVALTIWSLSASWQARSPVIALFAAVALGLAFVNWSGARIVVPLVFGGIVFALLFGSLPQIRRPLLLFAFGSLLIFATPAAYYLRVPDGQSLAFARMEKSILHSGGWKHTLTTVPEPTVEAVIERQIRGTLRAFEPDSRGDASTFYNFARPFVDPATLGLALLGVVVIFVGWRQALPWVFPGLAIALTLVSTTLIVDPPNYHRLGVMLPALMLFAARALDWIRTGLPKGLVIALAVVALIGLVNLKWFFVDYPREGTGEFVMTTLTRMAAEDDDPIYVLTPGFPFQHEDLVLLDPEQRIQPPPARGDLDTSEATWIALGPNGAASLEPLRTQHPQHTLNAYRDNLDRVILYALQPP